MSEQNNNEWLITLLLCIFLGGLGVHRFYTKNTGIGVAQLLLSLFCVGAGGVWALFDLVLILIGKYKKGDGTLLTH